MKQITLTLFVSLVFSYCLFAQEAITTTGGEATGTGGSASYTVGQVFYQTHAGVDGSVAEGVQQPYEISIVTEVETNFVIDLKIDAYPNPTTDFLTLSIVDSDLSNMSYQLYNMQGRDIKSHEILSPETKIDLENLQPATYFVKVLQNNVEIKVFMVVKR